MLHGLSIRKEHYIKSINLFLLLLRNHSAALAPTAFISLDRIHLIMITYYIMIMMYT